MMDSRDDFEFSANIHERINGLSNIGFGVSCRDLDTNSGHSFGHHREAEADNVDAVLVEDSVSHFVCQSGVTAVDRTNRMVIALLGSKVIINGYGKDFSQSERVTYKNIKSSSLHLSSEHLRIARDLVDEAIVFHEQIKHLTGGCHDRRRK